AMGFVYLLTLLAVLHLTTSAQAASLSRQCRKACRNQIAACVGAGGHPRTCRRDVLGRCKREGVAACQSEALPPSLADACTNATGLYRASRLTPTVTAGQTYFIVVDGYGGAQGTFSLTVTPPAPTTTTTTLPGGGGCSSPMVIPASGGTVSGATSGTSALVGSCGSSGTSPERVYQWTPAVSGTATIQTCGAATTFDTVLYLRSGACASGPEVAGGCNDDACTNATGLYRASRPRPPRPPPRGRQPPRPRCRRRPSVRCSSS